MTTFNFIKQQGRAFDPTEYEATERVLLPEGEYLVSIVDSEMSKTSKGGDMLTITMQVANGAHEGATLKERLNVINDNPKAMEIAMQTLSRITKAAGLALLEDSEQLHGKRVVAKVSIKAGQGTYLASDGTEKPNGDQNVIKGYRSPTAVLQPAKQESATKEASPSASKVPWAK